MPDPVVTVDLSVIEHNARAVVERCKAAGIGAYGVTKGTCGMPSVARAMLRGGVQGLAESRFENIRRLRASGLECPIMLLRSPPMVRIEELVRTVDVSLQTELPVMREISRVAVRLGRVHNIILMIDLGDLREGIWPNDLIPTVEAIMELEGIRIVGVGTNLTCVNGVLPSNHNLSQLVGHAYKVEARAGLHLDFVSGGASSSLPLLLNGTLPHGINNLRIGEAILQGGRETFLTEPWKDLDQNAFRLDAELLEVKTKPSLPIGLIGFDAFGNRPRFVDEGDRLRAIANIGREDVIIDGLLPINAGVRILGASSDHLVLDVTDAMPPLKVADTVSFRLKYSALLTLMTSEYVEKAPMRDKAEKAKSRCISIHAAPMAAEIFTTTALSSRLKDIGILESTNPEAIPMHGGGDRRVAWAAIKDITDRRGVLGALWIDSRASLMPDDGTADQPADDSVLRRVLDRLRSKISPENIVLVGLRHAEPAESKLLKELGIKVFTIVEIDATGLRHVMREALKIVAAGTDGYHVHYSPDVTDMPGWMNGLGGITVRETHQAMEAVAANHGMLSMSVSGLTAALPGQIAAECTSFVLSAFGKSIL
jgi:ornithine racemase